VSGLDRYNARHVLAAVQSGAKEGWVDRLRGELLRPCRDVAADTLERLDRIDPPLNLMKSPSGQKKEKRPHEQRRILILPGIMGSLLHDRSGKLGAVWIDPWNIIFGDDFEALKLKWETEKSIEERLKPGMEPVPFPLRIPDADDAVQIEAYGVIPVIYDRMALALLHEFGPVVEFAPYDWRQPIGHLGRGLAVRIEALTKEFPAIQIALVAHSMGGLVAADAMKKLETGSLSVLSSIKAFIALGTPFLGSCNALRALRAERGDLQLIELLGRKSAGEIENVVQTFRGLFDLMPDDQKELLKPAVFAPGPLSRLSPEDTRLDSPHTLVREIPPSILERGQAIFCTKKSTLGRVVVREDGSIDYSETVGGDGTVTTRSALNADKLLSRGQEVDERHMTLPLDGKAIQHSIDWIAKQFAVGSIRSSSRDWPAAPEICCPSSREELIRHLEADDGLTLGDLVALLSLA
jgi:pimeloyl-ACP methyl ester carboxylesterase